MKYVYSIFWPESNTAEALKQKAVAEDTTISIYNSNFPKANETDNFLHQIIKNQPDSQRAKEICLDKNQFERIRPSCWIGAAKMHPTLFQKILLNPDLANWVNQFPENDPSGLLMIATYSKNLAEIAQTYGKEVISKNHRDTIEIFYPQNPSLLI